MLAGDDKDLRAKALDAANKPYTPPPPPPVAMTAPAMAAAPAAFGGLPEAAPFAASVSAGFGGKEAPFQPDHPER
jgi:hypothetical protein